MTDRETNANANVLIWESLKASSKIRFEKERKKERKKGENLRTVSGLSSFK